jgi:hypothetical protein
VQRLGKWFAPVRVSPHGEPPGACGDGICDDHPQSQGSEFAHTVVALPDGGSDILTGELVCTGITRAREHLTVVKPRAGLLGDALARQVKRASGLSFS